MNAGFIFHTETTATFHNHRVSPHADAASTIIRNAINFLPRFVFRLRIMYALGKFEFIVGRSSRSMAGGGGSIWPSRTSLHVQNMNGGKEWGKE